jgi:hypothetical protein
MQLQLFAHPASFMLNQAKDVLGLRPTQNNESTWPKAESTADYHDGSNHQQLSAPSLLQQT